MKKQKIKEIVSILCGNHNSTPYLDVVVDQLFNLFDEYKLEVREAQCNYCCHHSHCECMRAEGCKHCNI